jgi:hypothetical protein
MRIKKAIFKKTVKCLENHSLAFKISIQPLKKKKSLLSMGFEKYRLYTISNHNFLKSAIPNDGFSVILFMKSQC